MNREMDFDALLAAAPPDFAERFAASLNGLLLAETQDVAALLDWVGVAAMTPLRERVLILCAEYLSRTGQLSVDEALEKGRDILAGASLREQGTEEEEKDAQARPNEFVATLKKDAE